MRVLVVEDDLAVRRLIVEHLESHSLTVTAAATVAAGRAALAHTSFDVVILDLTLPDASGLEILRALRGVGSSAHVIILSGAGAEADRVTALDLGADDYVVKPFFVRELMARILAVGRRQDVDEATGLRYGPLFIDLVGRSVTVDGAPVNLTTREFDLLAYLAARPGQAFGRDHLLRCVWQSGADWQNPSTVTEHVRRLRAKIERDPLHPQFLQTVRGVGYRFDPASPVASTGDPSFRARRAQVEPAGQFVVVDRRIVSVDEAGVALVGAASEAELLGRDGLDFIAAQSRPATLARRAMDESGQSPRTQVLLMRRLDGTEVHVEVASSPTTWNGAPALLTTMQPAEDPSHLRHLVTGVFSEVSDAVIVTDPDFHVRSWNDAAERLYGWAEHEILGRHLADIVPFIESDEEAGAALRELEAIGRWHGERWQRARDGSIVHVRTSTTVINHAGERALVVSVNRPAPQPTAAPSAGAELIEEIRWGLDGDQFIVHYQPVVALIDRHLVALEALVRWDHPVRGVLAPSEFMDAAERSGMIIELGRVVLDKACRQVAEWRRSGLDLEIAVNLSTRQLADPGLFEDITATLEATGSRADALWLEVTETALVEDVDQAAALLHRLAALGVRIAIDDFGTGWASLTYLKQFPVHALKIDRSFVAGVDRNPQDAAIARSILSLGEELDLLVVAEGVETVGQQSALQALGCSVGQGYLYGRPTAAATVPTQRAHHLRRRTRSHEK